MMTITCHSTAYNCVARVTCVMTHCNNMKLRCFLLLHMCQIEVLRLSKDETLKYRMLGMYTYVHL